MCVCGKAEEKKQRLSTAEWELNPVAEGMSWQIVFLPRCSRRRTSRTCVAIATAHTHTPCPKDATRSASARFCHLLQHVACVLHLSLCISFVKSRSSIVEPQTDPVPGTSRRQKRSTGRQGQHGHLQQFQHASSSSGRYKCIYSCLSISLPLCVCMCVACNALKHFCGASPDMACVCVWVCLHSKISFYSIAVATLARPASAPPPLPPPDTHR